MAERTPISRLERNGWLIDGARLYSPSGMEFEFPSEHLALGWFAEGSAGDDERQEFDRKLRREKSIAGRQTVVQEHIDRAIQESREGVDTVSAAPCIGCARDTAPRQVYCNRCRKALRLEGAGQGRRYGFRMMDSPDADLPRMSDELREAVREAKP